MKNHSRFLALCAFFAFFSAFLGAKVSSGRILAKAAGAPFRAWVELGPGGSILVRALIDGGGCPSLVVDGRQEAFTARGQATTAFPGTVCEGRAQPLAQSIVLGGVQALPAPKPSLKRIVFIGDTGCKIALKGDKVKTQNCLDPAKWPFARLARAAAEWNPDLVVHVGDYHYREAPCPEGDGDCAGATSGDNWQSWQEDFFAPARPLLGAAPWVFVRGNHELCARGGLGWFKFLDPAPYSGQCADATSPYQLTLGDHRLVVIDAASDANIQPSLDQLNYPQGMLTWVALHRPFLTPGADDELTVRAASMPSGLEGMISAVFAGHQHHLSLNQFHDSRPPELISGNGGTKLEKPEGIDPAFVSRESSAFGFLTLERTDYNHWAVVEHDVTGAPVFSCQLTETVGSKASLSCGH